MTTYRGNRGNLLQHWTFCEVVTSLAAHYGPSKHLFYFDAHSMAPFGNPVAGREDDPTAPEFDRCRAALPGSESVYEQTWLALTGVDDPHYPSSAAFLLELWSGPLSLTLCETNACTVSEIAAWLATSEVSRRLKQYSLHFAGWQHAQILEGLRCDLFLLQFDPYRFDTSSHRCGWNGGNLYPQDLKRITDLAGATDSPAVVQLSSYSVRGEASLDHIVHAVSGHMTGEGFDQLSVVKADRSMVSLVFGRDLDLGDSFVDAPDRFLGWLKNI